MTGDEKAHPLADWRYWLTVIAVGLAYVGAAEFGLSQAHVAEQVSPVWPPTGLALAAVILLGVRIWPAITLGAFSANMLHVDGQWAIAAGIAVGNTLEAVTGGFILRRFVGLHPQLDRLRDVIGLALVAAAMCTMISATIGVSSLILGGAQPSEQFGYLWRTWWLGDAMGALVVAPVLLTWLTRAPQRAAMRHTLQAAALLALLTLVSAAVFLSDVQSATQLKYAIFPFFIWAALGFGQRVTAAAVLIAASIAVWGAATHAPSDAAAANEQLLLLQTFMGVGSVTALALAAIMAERKRAEAEVRRERDRMNLAFSAGHMGAWEWNIAEQRVTWTPQLEQIHGLAPGTFPGTFEGFASDIHPEDRDRVLQTIQRTIKERTDYHMEYRIVRPDGATAWLEARGKLFLSHQGDPVRMAGVCADVTQRKLAELELARHREGLAELVSERTRQLEESHERLRLTERMAALGTLSAGLGHDIGNLLLPMRLRLDAMEARGISPDVCEDMQAIRHCADYLQKLANGLRLFALDPDDPRAAMQTTNLDEWWVDVHPFMRNAIPRQAKLDCKAPRGLAVRIARANLTQAIFNLVQNAGDAVHRDGTGAIQVWAEASGPDHVRIGVTDNGAGMPEDVRRRCLEPFFTTKTRGISTGLGLALVHGIVQKAGGTIEVQSDIGRGTTFVLTLPAAPRAESQQISAARPGARAVVDVRDPRSRAYIDTVLQSLSIDVVPSEECGEHATLWVVESSSDLIGRAIDHLARQGDSRMIVLGNGVSGPEDPRIAWLRGDPRPPQIRAALYQAAEAVSSPASAKGQTEPSV